jgi:hypothetical protein
MISRSLTADEFYAERDDRTDRCVDSPAYQQAQLSVVLDPWYAETLAGQVAILIIANLCARWCRNVRFSVPRVMVHPRVRSLVIGEPQGVLEDAVVSTAQATDPFGTFDIDPPSSDAVHLHVGGGTGVNELSVRGAGWLALAGRHLGTVPEHDTANPFGAILAACVGSALMFRLALRDHRVPETVRLSLWNLRGGANAWDGPSAASVEFGHAYLIGCGAVGSAISYLLPVAHLRGEITLVDGDRVEVSNLNRSPLFTLRRVEEPKVAVVSEFLGAAGYTTTAVPAWFDEALRDRDLFAKRPDLVIPVANERHVRRLVAHQLPPLQVYGTTGQDWNAFLGRHVPLLDDCLACRFPADQVPPTACATGRVDREGEGPGDGRASDAALPFLPTAAAAFAVAELAKLATIGRPEGANFACLDFRGDFADFITEQRFPTAGCSCANQRDAWTRINRGTRFAPLSP